ncbi:MAG TPA: tail fiber protein [Usitatibacter sp.]|nr:tail fiber protein [Usitatibacter sp.]
MAEPFLSEIRIMSFSFAPQGWALCSGQLLPINQNQALFSLLGTTFGGNGQTNFALPDLRGRVPIHVGIGFTLGQRGGEESHTVTVQEMPAHQHTMNAMSVPATTNVPTGAMLAQSNAVYTPAANLTTLAAGEIAGTGGSQPHTNMQPYLGLNFSIALQGIFPSQV